jgi:acyl-CoA thioester hydrolase
MHEVYENVVRFEETDAQGIVFYGNYVTFQDEAFTAYLEAIGYPYEDLKAADWDVHVVHIDLDYRRSAQFRDTLRNAVRVSAIRESSIEFEYECRNDEGEVLVEGGVVHVAVDESGEPTRVPDDFREAVLDFQDEAPDPV